MAIEQNEFGKLPDGRTVHLFTLDGGQGVTAQIITYGGRIVSLKSPDRTGTSGEIGLGFDNLEHYLAKRNFYGALVGRVANRIGQGGFSLDGATHRLWTDGNGIHLHGGEHGFSSKLWQGRVEGDRLRLDYVSPDGEEHYPGTLSVTVWYSVQGRDLRIDYQATTDKPTIVNLTNHEFFNLNGCAGDVLRHKLTIKTTGYTPVGPLLLPTGEVLPVAGTPMDFTGGKAIGFDMAKVAGGYDHNFILARSGAGEVEWLVSVADPDSGRTMEMGTTEPCVQFYGGNSLDGSDIGLGGRVYRKHFAFCLEAQKHPDAIHFPHFASPVLRPGETYRQTTVYRFGTDGE